MSGYALAKQDEAKPAETSPRKTRQDVPGAAKGGDAIETTSGHTAFT
jgi:hypothetical protein